MNNESSSDIIERKFGQSVIKWKICNFCFETCRVDFLISTPEFCVDGQHATKWRMTLNPKMKKGEENAFHLTFERTGSDNVPERISVELKLWILDCEGNECEPVLYKTEFEEINRFEIPLWKISYIREKLKAELYKYGTLTIWCHIIIDFENGYEDIDGTSDIGLKTLSENLLKLYNTGDDHDVTLRFQAGNISAHKAILFSRSPVLADMITTEITVADLSFLDYKTMQNIMAYFYSGNINYIAKCPSILMFECAVYLNVNEIMQYYNPMKLEIQSTIDLKEHAFVWAIKNFRQLRGDCIKSPVLASEYIDAAFMITFNAEGSDCTKSEYLEVFVDVVEGTLPKHGCLEIAIVEECDYMHAEKILLSSESKGRFCFEKFISKANFKAILKKLLGDTLNLVLKIELHNAAVTANEKYAINSSSLSKRRCRESLSSYVTFIFEHNIFTDIVVEAEGIPIKANKCILSARSLMFRTMLQETKDDRIILRNMKSNILRLVISYIYSGVYKNSNPDDIFEVYRAAAQFVLPSLKQTCREILQENCNVQFVCDVLIFSDEQKDLELKNTALNFIRVNKNCVFEDKNWKSLIVNKPSLYTDVMESLNDNAIS